MRKKGNFEYGEEHELILYKLITDVPRTTNWIALSLRKNYFEKIHVRTVERMLKKLDKAGKIKKFKSGRTTLWQR